MLMPLYLSFGPVKKLFQRSEQVGGKPKLFFLEKFLRPRSLVDLSGDMNESLRPSKYSTRPKKLDTHLW